MEENYGDDEKSKLLEIINQQNEANQQLKSALVEKDILIKSLQKKILELEKGAVDVTEMLKCEENKNMDSQSLGMDFNDETNESENKRIIQESAQVDQAHDSSNDSSAKPVVKALRNPLILTKILRNVRTMNLLNNCRLVSREWRDLSTDILLKRKNVQVKFMYNRLQFNLTRKENQTLTKPLHQLTTLLTTSTTFPCANFGFRGNLKMDDAQAFLSEFGNNIKELQLAGKTDLKFLRKLFVEQVLHLERLELNNVTIDGDLFFGNAQAPKLSSLISLKLCSISSSSTLIKEIVDAAPTLQECTGHWSVEKIELLPPHRLNLLKSLYLKPEVSDVDTLEKLTKMNLQLKYFDINYNKIQLDGRHTRDAHKEILTKFDRINSKILSLNQNTLGEIKLTPYFWDKCLIDWPKMVNVMKLTVSENDEGQLNLPLFKISKTFPKLHTLRITGSLDSDYDSFKYKKSRALLNDVAPSLKVLELEGCAVTLFRQYSKRFPNVQELSLGGMKNSDFLITASAIWSMEKLKSLKLTFEDCTASVIDAGFTGMKKATCRFLRSPPGAEMEFWDVEKFRVYTSILDLNDLEKLHLPQGFQNESPEFGSDDDEDDDEDKDDDKEKDKPSFVSFKYAFNLMPQLRVFF